MPLIDLQGHFGVESQTLACRPPGVEAASAYASQFDVETLCLASAEAATDLVGGNERLAEAIKTDVRFKGWLELSVHQPDLSQELARRYLVKTQWVGARFEQAHEGDAIDSAGGLTIVNALRRYGKPILVTCHSPATLAAAVRVARTFHTLRFLLSPQSEALTSDTPPTIKDVLNISFLPGAAWCERDVIAQAVATMGERRILWSSDWGRLHPAAAMGMLRDSSVGKLQRERIVLRNGRELLVHE